MQDPNSARSFDTFFSSGHLSPFTKMATPEDVLQLTRPTDGFLCPLSANTYKIEFLQFIISDYDTKKIIFEVGRDSPPPQDMSLDFSSLGEDMYRKIKYEFSEDVLRLPFIETSLVFSVGPREIRDFRMIERHYFRNKLVKSFDFTFGFCIPGSTNTWDAVYSVPALDEDLIAEMIEHPFETRSDSFYFVDGRLVMHNKAAYKYFREDSAQSKRSYEDKFGSKGSKPAAGAKVGAKVVGAKGSAAAAAEEEDADVKVADAKESSSSAAPRGLGSKAGAKEQVWSKESDYN